MMFPILQADMLSAEQLQRQQEAVKEFTTGLITDPVSTLNTLLDKAIEFGIKLVVAVLIYLVGAWLIRALKRRMRAAFERRKSDKAMASFATSFVTITLSVILIVITAGTLGINTTSIAALLAAGGMAIGLALSGTVQNFAGGIMILSFKPFKSGDLISAQGFTGTVHEISIVNTSILTVDGRTIIIPNGALFNGNIDNHSKRGIRRVEWTVGLAYGTDVDKAMDRILAILREDKRVLGAGTKGAAEPFVALAALGASSVDFVARAWTHESDCWPVFYDVNRKLYIDLQADGFSFPFPQMDVHVSNQ